MGVERERAQARAEGFPEVETLTDHAITCQQDGRFRGSPYPVQWILGVG
jgi:hypothetical protein